MTKRYVLFPWILESHLFHWKSHSSPNTRSNNALWRAAPQSSALGSSSATTVNSEIWRLVSNLPSVTNFGDLVLWKCSYGPWDHFTFPAKKWIRLVFYQSDSNVWGKHDFQVDWLDAKFHHGELGKRLLFFRERLLYFGEGRLYFWERRSSFWGAPDSANNADKVTR